MGKNIKYTSWNMGSRFSRYMNTKNEMIERNKNVRVKHVWL